MKRIVIFTSGLQYTVRKGIGELLKQNPELEVLIMIHKPRKGPYKILRNQIRNIKKNGWRWIPYQMSEIQNLIAGRWRRPQWHSQKRPGGEYRVNSLTSDRRIRIEVFENIHDQDALQSAKAFAPELGIALASPILKASVFEIPSLGTINLHKGKVPEFRGMPPAFWELWNDEQSVGCTVHKVAAGLDTGDVILADKIDRRPFSTVRGMRVMLDEMGIRMTCEAVKKLVDQSVQFRPQANGGKTYSKPTLAQVAALDQHLKQHDNSVSARSVVKALASTCYTYGLRPPVRLFKRLSGLQETIVLLYHRVSDEFRDGVTVGIEQFDQQMRYLASRYPIASIDDVIHGRTSQATGGRPVVTVTFDDGYRDNYDNAAPILLRHGIPAAFFVSTGMMGSEKGFDHDLQKLGRSLPNMTWNQLREMHASGFTIGSHTVSHLNCANASEPDLRNELAESRDRLKQELGLDEVIFAYPFGKRADITPEALQIVKEEGYIACLSAYGGINRGPVDRYNILRMGVSYNFRPGRFAARVEGW